MTTEEWFDGFTREEVWGHIAQHYLLVAWFPRIFSGIHSRCDDLEVRKDCARHLTHEIPWSAALCATALIEEEVVEISQTVGRALVQHYGCRPEWGGLNYEEAGETKKAILKQLKSREDLAAAESAMREMHRLLEDYADGLGRRYR